MIKRVVIPPYDKYDLSTFVISNETVYIGHFGGSSDDEGKLLTTVEAQMGQTLKNLEKLLKEIDLGLENVVKLTVILRDIKDFHKMHNVWAKKFTNGKYPVRTCITSDFIDDHCLIQIEGIACYN